MMLHADYQALYNLWLYWFLWHDINHWLTVIFKYTLPPPHPSYSYVFNLKMWLIDKAKRVNKPGDVKVKIKWNNIERNMMTKYMKHKQYTNVISNQISKSNNIYITKKKSAKYHHLESHCYVHSLVCQIAIHK